MKFCHGLKEIILNLLTQYLLVKWIIILTLIYLKKQEQVLIYRVFSQISMLFNNLGTDGGLFIVIGKNEK